MGVHGNAVDREVSDGLHDFEEDAVQLFGSCLHSANYENGSSERELNDCLKARLRPVFQNLLGELVKSDL